MTKTKSLLIILCIIGLSALVFSQCIGSGGLNGTTAATGNRGANPAQTGNDSIKGNKKIKASVALEPKEFELFSRMAKQYADMHDGITIEVENVPLKDAYELWKKAGQIGEAPDLMLLDNHWVYEFAALGFLQPMDEFFSSDQQNSRIGILMDQVKWNGYIWGVPKDVDPYILAWNKTTAAQFHLEHAPETHEELLAWNKTMLKPEQGQFGIYTDPSDPYAFIALTSSLTGGWLNSGMVWTDQAAALKKLQGFLIPQAQAEWSSSAYSANYPQPSSAWSPWEQLKKGKLGALVTTVAAFKNNAADHIAIAAIPPYSGKEHKVWLKGRSFAVSSRSEHVRVLMDWIKEMTTSEMGTRYWNESKVLPAQIPSYSLSPLRGDEHIQSYDWLIRQGIALPSASETPKHLALLQTELKELWKGEETLEQLMDQINHSWSLTAKKQ